MDRDPSLDEIEAEMDRRTAAGEKGFRRADVGRLLGLDSSQVSRLFNGPRRLQVHELRRLREWLSLDKSGASNLNGGRTGGAANGGVVPMPGLVPLFDWTGASSSRAGDASPEQKVLGYVPMHPAQAHLWNPFALRVPDNTNSPRYEIGETVYVAPNQWPMEGRFFVLELVDGSKLLRKLVRRTGDEVEVDQINPPHPQTFKIGEQIRAVHAIVGTAS